MHPFGEPCGVGVIRAEPCPRELGCEIRRPRRGVVLAACVLASSMAFIDSSVLTVALPSLRAAFGADLGTVQWVMNGYLLAFAALTLIGGALADTHGKARMLAIGCLMFGAVSAACALAPSIRLADRRACHPGHCGSSADPGKPCADRRHLSEGGTRPGNRRVGGGVSAHLRCGPRRRRLADRPLRLGSRVLDQSAARDPGRRSAVAGSRPRTGSEARRFRSARCNPDRSVARGVGLELEPNRP